MSDTPFRTPAAEALAGIHYDGAAAAADFVETNGSPAERAPSLLARSVSAVKSVRVPMVSPKVA